MIRLSKGCLKLLALALVVDAGAAAGAAGLGPPPQAASGSPAPMKADPDRSQLRRAAAAKALAAHSDAASLATAAALTYTGPATRSRADTVRAAGAALELAVRASEIAPDNVALTWLRLRLCVDTPACDVRDAATTMRWVDPENAAAWMPTLAAAQRDRDSTEIDRVLNDMAQGSRFNLYTNRLAVSMYDALNRARRQLPADFLSSDAARLREAIGIAGTAAIPSFSPLINACREAIDADRREACLKLAKVMQRADTVMAQLVGFAIEKRLAPAESKEARAIAERRHGLEWRTATAGQYDAPLLPWVKAARARSRLAKMRGLPREDDVSAAILREHNEPLEPPESNR